MAKQVLKNEPLFIKTWRTATPTIGESYNGESETIPDQALPMSVIIERYVQGNPLGSFQPIYQFKGEQSIDNLEEFPEIDKMDKMQRLEFSMALKEGVKEMKESLKLREKLLKEANEAVKLDQENEAQQTDLAAEGEPSN